MASHPHRYRITVTPVERDGLPCRGRCSIEFDQACGEDWMRVVEGTQTMTVYKPLDQLATQAAKLAVDLARGEKPAYNSHYDNGEKSVDSVLLQPVAPTRDNVDKVITDGFYTHAQVYGN